MKKLSLSPDALRVESFRTDEPADGRGTVDGAQLSVGCPPTGCTCGADLTTERDANKPTYCYCCA